MSTPDFDSMSPEELMAWMESLARRQGADEGFTSDTIMDVPEIDPSTVEDTGPGYIPYGMDPEVWAEKQRQEEERKAARRAAQQSSQPASTPAPTPPVPVQEAPAAAPVAATPAAASAEPDFDSMSPEELMAWMESLARRQGADEGFTTDKIVDVPEIDPTTVQDTGPGYIPYGMEPEVWAEKQRQEEERKAARRAAQTSTSATPVTPPAASTPTPPPAPTPVEEPFQTPLWDEAPAASVETPVAASTPAADDPLAWLASLSSGESSTANNFDELDLAALGAPLESASSSQIDDPMAWLESLSQPQASIPGLDQFSLDFGDAITGDAISPAAAPSFDEFDLDEEVDEIDFEDFDEEETSATQAPAAQAPAATAASGGANTLEWLESLARRQGVDEDELITDASLDIPLPEANSDNGPGYTDYSFETPEETPGIDPLSFLESFDDDEYDLHYEMDEEEDPDSAWLDTLASGGNADTPEVVEATTPAAVETAPDTEDVMEHLARNEVNPDEIESWMSSLLEQGAARTDIPDYIEDDGEELAQANLPDWLIEQVGAPPTDQSPISTSSVQLPENFFDAEPSEEALASLDDLDELVALEEDDADSEALEALGLDFGDEAEELTPSTAETVEAPTFEMPDWLTEDIDEYEAVDFNSIFDDDSQTLQPQTVTGEPVDDEALVINSSDPWIEAFETEREQGLDDITHIPAWYAEKLSQMQGDQVIESPIPASAAATSSALASIVLADANLPDEEELPSGALQSIPDWLRSSLASPQPLDTPLPEGVVVPVTPTAQVAPAEEVVSYSPELSFDDEEALPELDLADMPGASSGELPVWLREQILDEDSAEIEIPDWLREAGITDVSEVPEWLTESITTEEPIVEPSRTAPNAPTVIVPAIQPTPTPIVPVQPAAQVQPPAPVQPVSPAYVPVTASSINVPEVLTAARSGVREGNVETALQNYEAVVRSNQSIQDVIEDLNSLTRDEKYKSNPAVYRVLGDGHMRTGNLQEALNTYRKALNML